ncbi:zinc ribbon domain-containing protein [Companilactobacillus furfuricola]|uniref:zinc ribbon domain-containing protein n=1 Tax=Companilactobacillus furfuricola TaxID=1462575 RepID=UPI0013DDC69D|nr:zinc ribbon domain-containing protein [Companilactobacillus furfuricola]
MNTCTNCGAPLATGTKFCTKCGQAVNTAASMNTTTATATMINNNPTVTAFKQHSANYFAWLKQSVFDPTIDKDDTQYFGLISFLIHILLISFGVFHIENGVLSKIQQALQGNEFTDSITKGFGLNITTGFPLFMKLFATVAFFYVVYLAVGFFTKKFFADPKVNFFNYTNTLARYSNVLLFVEAIFALLMVVLLPANFTTENFENIIKVLFFTVVIGGAAWSVAFIASIIIDQAKMRLNRIYVAMIALIGSHLVLWFVVNFMLNEFANKYGEMIKSAISRFSDAWF